MTGLSGFIGSRRRNLTAGRGDGPTTAGAPGPVAPTTAVARQWQRHTLPPGAGSTDGQRPSPLVIHAPRAGDATPVRRPSPAA